MTATLKSTARTFTVDVLFSESLDFDLADIVQAVAEDFPCQMVVAPACMRAALYSTDSRMRVTLEPADPDNGSAITLSSTGTPDDCLRAADHTELAWRSGAYAETALAAIEDHKSLLRFTVIQRDRSLAARFRAARQLTAVSAVFAQLPIALGVMVHWSDHVVSPEAWVTAAHHAAKGEWPMTEWLSYRSGWIGDDTATPVYSVGYTTGLAHFLDLEFQMEAAPIRPSDVIEMLFFTSWLPLQCGNTYRDGDTVGQANSPVKYTLRCPRPGKRTSKPVMALLHPDTPIDEHAVYGPNPLQAAPDWYDNERWATDEFMRDLLGKPRTVH